MKKLLILTSLLLSCAPLAIFASCDSVKADIAHKIMNNGVPETGFKLEIVPSKAAQHTAGKIVGNCDMEKSSIVYFRFHGNEAATTTQTNDTQVPSVTTENTKTSQ